MAPTRRWVPYRGSLTRRAQSLRRDLSPAEKKLWYELLRDLPEKFTRQKPLGRYVVDFYCSSMRLVIEVDGDSHFTDEGQRYDTERIAELERKGIRVLRFTNLDVMQSFEGVCAAILTAINRPLAS